QPTHCFCRSHCARAFSTVYSGMSRSKNALNVIMLCMCAMCVVSLQVCAREEREREQPFFVGDLHSSRSHLWFFSQILVSPFSLSLSLSLSLSFLSSLVCEFGKQNSLEKPPRSG